jgi:ketosteroid isomerase-like protein
LLVSLIIFCSANSSRFVTDDREALLKTTQAIRDAFGRADVPAIVALHHPDVVKAFGPNNYVNGREALEKGLTQMFQSTRLEFVENRVQSIIFNGDTAIETSIFQLKRFPKTVARPLYQEGVPWWFTSVTKQALPAGHLFAK